MQTTRIFKSGNSMAIRLPQGFQFLGEEVQIRQVGNEIRIKEIPKNLGVAFELFSKMSKDLFPKGRNDMPPQKREDI